MADEAKKKKDEEKQKIKEAKKKKAQEKAEKKKLALKQGKTWEFNDEEFITKNFCKKLFSLYSFLNMLTLVHKIYSEIGRRSHATAARLAFH